MSQIARFLIFMKCFFGGHVFEMTPIYGQLGTDIDHRLCHCRFCGFVCFAPDRYGTTYQIKDSK